MKLRYGVDYIGIFAAAVCFDKDGNFLMGKRGGKARDRHGAWEFPGGGVEIGEPIEEALKREFREECGTEPINFKRIDVLEFLERGMHYLGAYYIADIDREAVYIAEPVYDAFEWFTLETIPETLEPDKVELVKKAIEMWNTQI